MKSPETVYRFGAFVVYRLLFIPLQLLFRKGKVQGEGVCHIVCRTDLQ